MSTRRNVLLLGTMSVVGYAAGGLWVAGTYESLRDGPLPVVLVAYAALLACMAVPISVAILPEGRPEGQVAALLFAAAGVVWSGYVFGMAATIPPRDQSAEDGTRLGVPTTAQRSRGAGGV